MPNKWGREFKGKHSAQQLYCTCNPHHAPPTMGISYYDDEKALDEGKVDFSNGSSGAATPAGDADKHNYVVEVAPLGSRVVVEDAVFGEVGEDGPNYRNVSWMGASALMTKANVGLGVLSIPEVFKQVGLVPGLILILVIQGIATCKLRLFLHTVQYVQTWMLTSKMPTIRFAPSSSTISKCMASRTPAWSCSGGQARSSSQSHSAYT